MKIIGGKYKGTTLLVPKGRLVRPTLALKKEALFNILTSYCYFVEENKTVVKFLNSNCYKILKKNQFEILNIKYNNLSIKTLKKNINIIFFDPPYNYIIKESMFDLIIEKTTSNPIFILETSNKTHIPKINYLKVIDERFFGKTKISFLIKK